MSKFNFVLTILLIQLVFCVNESFSQTRVTKSPCFSDKQIDLSANVLSANYHGNDLKTIADEVIRRSSFKKDEFETTPQFEERVKNENKKPLLGELNSGSNFAFEVSDTTFLYDADKKIMNANLVLTRNLNWASPCNTNRQTFSISGLYKSSISIPMSFSLEIAKARNAKPNLRTLLIGFIYKFDTNENIILAFREIWLYDVATGEIFLKQKSDLNKIQKESKKREDGNKKQEENKIIQDREKHKQQVATAKILYEKGDYEEAMSELRRVLVSEPMNGEAYLLLGKIHYRRKNLEQTISSLKTALFWDNRLLDAHIILGNIYLEKGDCATAQIYLRSAITIDSKNQEMTVLRDKISEQCKLSIESLSPSINPNSNINSLDLTDVGSLIDYATQKVNPIYPQQARTIKQTGVVKVEIVIDENGDVVEIQKAIGPSLLQSAAKDAARQWKFKPYIIDGKSVKVKGFISFNFSL